MSVNNYTCPGLGLTTMVAHNIESSFDNMCNFRDPIENPLFYAVRDWLVL